MATLRMQLDDAKKTEEELRTALDFVTKRARDFQQLSAQLETRLKEVLEPSHNVFHVSPSHE